MNESYCTCGEVMVDFGTPFGWTCNLGLKCPDLGFGIVPSRPSWDDWALNLAKAVAARADCRRAQHGAVILSPEHRVVSVGYNGYPAGAVGCLAGGCPRGSVPPSQLPHRSPYNEGVGRCDAVHAEANALLYADRASVQGGTIYVTGQPCHGCEVLIRGSGLAFAVYPGATGTLRVELRP